jgi:hypothetical protein
VIVLAGCGGSSSSNSAQDFKPKFTAAVDQFKSVSGSIGSEIQKSASQTDAEIGTAFKQLADQWKKPLAKLTALTAPKSMQSDFTTLSTNATHVESDLKAVAAAAAAHSKTDATQAATSLVKDILAAKAASERLTTQLGVK